MPCSNGKLVRRLIKEARKAAKSNVIELAAHQDIRVARTCVVRSVAAYCVLKCGGCPLTRALEEPVIRL